MPKGNSVVVKTITGMRTAFRKIETRIKINHHKIKTFQPKVTFSFEKGQYLVKTAETWRELEAALRLRYSVFYNELLKKRSQIGIDVDHMDLICDHLLIIDKQAQRVIGTYRLNCSKFSDEFYSSGEFHIDHLLDEDGIKVEAGRACIDKDYRNGAVITLLWRAIGEYMSRTDAKALFGCASVFTTDTFESALVYKYLKDHGHMDLSHDIVPTKKYRMTELQSCLNYIETSSAKFDEDAIAEQIPALFKTYLKAGTKVLGEPALDKDFQCIDFLILLKKDEMNPLFVRKYFTP